jgi:hypothetical protein
MPGESPAVPTEDRVRLNHLQRSPPTGPESVQHNPQEPVASAEAQATRRVPLANRKLVAKREYLRLQGSAASKTGAIKAKRATKRVLIVVATMISRIVGTPVFFRSDGVFGNHSQDFVTQFCPTQIPHQLSHHALLRLDHRSLGGALGSRGYLNLTPFPQDPSRDQRDQ